MDNPALNAVRGMAKRILNSPSDPFSILFKQLANAFNNQALAQYNLKDRFESTALDMINDQVLSGRKPNLFIAVKAGAYFALTSTGSSILNSYPDMQDVNLLMGELENVRNRIRQGRIGQPSYAGHNNDPYAVPQANQGGLHSDYFDSSAMSGSGAVSGVDNGSFTQSGNAYVTNDSSLVDSIADSFTNRGKGGDDSYFVNTEPEKPAPVKQNTPKDNDILTFKEMVERRTPIITGILGADGVDVHESYNRLMSRDTGIAMSIVTPSNEGDVLANTMGWSCETSTLKKVFSEHVSDRQQDIWFSNTDEGISERLEYVSKTIIDIVNSSELDPETEELVRRTWDNVAYITYMTNQLLSMTNPAIQVDNVITDFSDLKDVCSDEVVNLIGCLLSGFMSNRALNVYDPNDNPCGLDLSDVTEVQDAEGDTAVATEVPTGDTRVHFMPYLHTSSSALDLGIALATRPMMLDDSVHFPLIKYLEKLSNEVGLLEGYLPALLYTKDTKFLVCKTPTSKFVVKHLR